MVQIQIGPIAKPESPTITARTKSPNGSQTGIVHVGKTGPPVPVLGPGCRGILLGAQATRAQCSSGAPCGPREEAAAAKGPQCACALVVVVVCSVPAVRAAFAAMAQPGKLLKEQKYDRQLR